jgi:hypothetical protein
LGGEPSGGFLGFEFGEQRLDAGVSHERLSVFRLKVTTQALHRRRAGEATDIGEGGGDHLATPLAAGRALTQFQMLLRG